MAERLRPAMAILFLGLLSSASVASEPPQTAPVRQLWVIDGDTIEVPRPEDAGRRERIRLEAIDAPETRRPSCEAERLAGQAAKSEAIRIVRSGRTATIARGKLDRYGRTLGRIAIDGKDIGEALLAARLALPYRPGPAAKAERQAHWCGRER